MCRSKNSSHDRSHEYIRGTHRQGKYYDVDRVDMTGSAAPIASPIPKAVAGDTSRILSNT